MPHVPLEIPGTNRAAFTQSPTQLPVTAPISTCGILRIGDTGAEVGIYIPVRLEKNYAGNETIFN